MIRANLVPAALIACAMSLTSGAQQAPPQGPAAQPPPAREMPRPEELEPAVDTTHAPAPAPPPRSGADASSSRGSASGARESRARAARGDAAATAARTDGKHASGKQSDRLQLDPTEITGNRELPKVLYIVPWKRSDLGDLAGRPVNSLLDEVLQPLDRDVFRRENRYYDALKPAAAAPKADLSGDSAAKP